MEPGRGAVRGSLHRPLPARPEQPAAAGAGPPGGAGRLWHQAINGAITDRPDEGAEACEAILASNVRDPEAIYHVARMLARCGRLPRALELVSRSVDEGYFNVELFERDPWLDPLRREQEFAATLAQANARRAHARDAFERAGGDKLFARAKQVS